MEHIFTIAALWLGLAVFSAVIAYHLRISIALIEICVGVLTAAVAGYLGKTEALGSNQEWLRFLAAFWGCPAHFSGRCRARTGGTAQANLKK